MALQFSWQTGCMTFLVDKRHVRDRETNRADHCCVDGREQRSVCRFLTAEGPHLMSASPVSAESSASVTKPLPPESDKLAASSHRSVGWKKYVTPLLVVALGLAVLITITRNWNAWEGGKVEQVTDDAYVRGDLTPLSTKVAGIVRTVHVADFQRVHKGDLIVELEDDD